jgi:hypothetical protein
MQPSGFIQASGQRKRLPKGIRFNRTAEHKTIEQLMEISVGIQELVREYGDAINTGPHKKEIESMMKSLQSKVDAQRDRIKRLKKVEGQRQYRERLKAGEPRLRVRHATTEHKKQKSREYSKRYYDNKKKPETKKAKGEQRKQRVYKGTYKTEEEKRAKRNARRRQKRKAEKEAILAASRQQPT